MHHANSFSLEIIERHRSEDYVKVTSQPVSSSQVLLFPEVIDQSEVCWQFLNVDFGLGQLFIILDAFPYDQMS